MICQRLRRRQRRQSSGWKPRKVVRHMITSSALPPRLPLHNNFVLTVGDHLRNHSLSIVSLHHCFLSDDAKQMEAGAMCTEELLSIEGNPYRGTLRLRGTMRFPVFPL